MIKLGIIGVGTIACAVVKGLKAKYGDDLSVYLSPRNAAKAEALAKEYKDVKVTGSNQEVVDAADWIVFSVLPSAAEETARALSFAPRHRVISLVSSAKLEDLTAWFATRPSLCRVIPQTFIEHRTGPVLVYPADPGVVDLFTGLGEVITPVSEEAFNLAQTLSCVMGPFFFWLDRVVAWMKDCGLPPEQSAAYLEALFPAMTDYASRTSPRELDELWKEVTPGGLNEMAIRMIREDGGFEAWIRALDAVRKRII